MSLLDAAGSERVETESLSTATARDEYRSTIAGLQAVGEVLHSVLHQEPHLPYNDHVITKACGEL